MQGFRTGQKKGPNIHVYGWNAAKLLQNRKSEREIRARETETHFAVSPVEHRGFALARRELLGCRNLCEMPYREYLIWI